MSTAYVHGYGARENPGLRERIPEGQREIDTPLVDTAAFREFRGSNRPAHRPGRLAVWRQ